MRLIRLKNRFKNFFMRHNKDETLRAKIVLSGNAEDAISDLRYLNPKVMDAVVYLRINAKSAEGAWHEIYELPAIIGKDATNAQKHLDMLYKQARITKDAYSKAQKEIERLVAFSSPHDGSRYGGHF